jgi:hypothetical protein
MPVTSRCLWTLIVSLLTISVASAKDVPVRLSDTLIFQHYTDNKNGESNDDDYSVVINRLNLSATSDSLTTSARVDSMYFHDSPIDWHRDDARLERISLRYTLGNWTLKVGDYYRQLGRGIALALRKVDEAGLDIGLRGGEAAYSNAHHKLGVFVGRTNIVNIDKLKQRFVEDPEDILAGGWYAWRGLKWAEIGAHYVFRKNKSKRSASELDDASNFVGTTLKFPSLGGYGSLFLEADYQQMREVDVVTDGKAAYGALDIFLGDTSVLVEGIYLDSIQQFGSTNLYGEPVRYNLPPTLERIDQETSKGQTEWGGKLRIEHALSDGDAVLYGNGVYKTLDPNKDSEVRQVHAFGGTEIQYSGGRSRANLSGGWRDEANTAGDDAVDIKGMYHVEVDVLQYIGKGYAVLLATNYEFRDLEGDEYLRGSVYLGLEKSGLGTLTFEHGLDTSDTRDEIRSEFFAGILSWEATRWMKVRSTIGTQRGGLKCIGGVCRIYPSFSGYHLELLANHNLGG